MVTHITSTTKANIDYAVTVEHGRAVSCTCPDHIYRHRTCKHMAGLNADIASEIERAARFLAVKLLVREMHENWRFNRELAWDNRF